MSDSDVESYKQIKSDLDVLRQSVEKSELWVYKSKSADEHGKKKNKDDEEEIVTERKNSPKKSPPTLTSSDKQGSAIDLDIGPPLHGDQAEEYKKIKQVESGVFLFCKGNQLSWMVRTILVRGFLDITLCHWVWTLLQYQEPVTERFIVISKRNRVLCHITMETSTLTTSHCVTHGFKMHEFLTEPYRITAACFHDLFRSLMERFWFHKEVVTVLLKEMGWFFEEVVLHLEFLIPTET